LSSLLKFRETSRNDSLVAVQVLLLWLRQHAGLDHPVEMAFDLER
jgi:hypothetical protein